MNAIKTKSWKTSGGGAATILLALGSILQAYTDGDPATLPTWGIIVPQIITGITLLFARDNDKSSEQVGAKT